MCAHNSLGEREVEEARQGSWVPALCLAEGHSKAPRDSRRGLTAPALQELYTCCQRQMCHMEAEMQRRRFLDVHSFFRATAVIITD